ncbi:hypothetical protein BDQ12DRAFT_638327 [Crucibulum laeve]|uniref:FAD-binding domain-containing protein n=1 Tax=Crucibulum laeve TaxID=68775 RepID=A0A5C3LJ25_9AGAR|nr:hypothetical protein BDQ12DRAFT_638327 [Crucibulum laeve]
MNGTARKASLQINILIVGGGITGLACAYALGRSGHRVRVLEGTGLPTRSGSIRVPPNLAKILVDWGLHEELSRGHKFRRSVFHSLEESEVIGYVEWQEDVMKETGGEFLLMHQDDLHNALLTRAASVGVTVSFNTTVNSVFVNKETGQPSARLADGTVLSADLLIGADGQTSRVREYVAGVPDYGVPSGQVYHTFTVPAAKLKSDPDWAKWIHTQDWLIWMGEHRSIIASPVRNGEDFCVHAYWPESAIRSKTDSTEHWDTIVPHDLIDFEGCHSSIIRLFRIVPDGICVKIVHRETPDDWVDDSGKIVLVGEAAHPMLSCTIQNTGIAVEDAAVLGQLLSRVRTSKQIPQLLDAFQDLRHSRCEQVKQSELSNIALLSMPSGPDRDARDAGMRLSLSAVHRKWDDEQLQEQWNDIGQIFGYNACEAADDWWTKWGALTDVDWPSESGMPSPVLITNTKEAAI